MAQKTVPSHKLLNFILFKKLGLCAIFFIFLLSCTLKKTDTQSQKQLPEGTYQAFKLQSNESIILFDTLMNYTITFENQKQLTITAEDNVMRCDISKLPGARPKITMISKSDVCCNSKTAETLFDFFGSSLQITQLNNKLILSSQKGVLELVK